MMSDSVEYSFFNHSMPRSQQNNYLARADEKIISPRKEFYSSQETHSFDIATTDRESSLEIECNT